MLLREHLEEDTKEQLLDQARSFELRKCSGLRKAALTKRDGTADGSSGLQFRLRHQRF